MIQSPAALLLSCTPATLILLEIWRLQLLGEWQSLQTSRTLSCWRTYAGGGEEKEEEEKEEKVEEKEESVAALSRACIAHTPQALDNQHKMPHLHLSPPI